MSEVTEVFSKADTTGAGSPSAPSAASSAGNMGNFIPRPLLEEFVGLLRERSFVRSLFKTRTMPSKTVDIPTIAAGTKVYYQGTEAAAATQTDLKSGIVSLEAKKLMARVRTSNELYEDANQDMQSIIVQDFAEAIAGAEEKAFLVGRSSAAVQSNSQADNHASDTILEAIAKTTNVWKGANGTISDGWESGVSYAMATTPEVICDGIATQGISNGALYFGAEGDSFYGARALQIIREAINKLGLLGRNKQDLALVLNPVSANQLLQSEQLLTLDKYGSNATILTGEVGQLFGVRIFESVHMPSGGAGQTAVDATAVTANDVYTYANGTDNKEFGAGGTAALVHVPSAIIGDRRLVSIKTDEKIENDAVDTVITSRVAFNMERSGAAVLIGNLDSSINTASTEGLGALA